MNDETRLFCIGHCCGGSLAQLAILDLVEYLRPRWYCYVCVHMSAVFSRSCIDPLQLFTLSFDDVLVLFAAVPFVAI